MLAGLSGISNRNGIRCLRGSALLEFDDRGWVLRVALRHCSQTMLTDTAAVETFQIKVYMKRSRDRDRTISYDLLQGLGCWQALLFNFIIMGLNVYNHQEMGRLVIQPSIKFIYCLLTCPSC